MVLFENFNTTYQSSPHFERHENFVIDLVEPGCAVVQTLKQKDRCSFVDVTPDCHEGVLLFDYAQFFFCLIDPQSMVVEVIGCLLLVFFGYYCFMVIGTVVDVFFCPPLKIITKKLGISENFAGITLLAFGNSVPDMVSGLEGITDEDVGTIYSDLMGSAMFITSVIAGSVIAYRPMKVEATTFTRDIAFHLLGVSFIDYSIKSSNTVSQVESIIIVGIYLFYFTVITVDQVILVRTMKSLEGKLKQQDNMTREELDRLDQLKEEAGIEIVFHPRPGLKIYLEEGSEPSSETTNKKMLLQFFDSLNPIGEDFWEESGWFMRFCSIITVPLNLILQFLLPVVDHNEERQGWSKLLNCMQLITMPFTICLITMGEHDFSGLKYAVATLCVSVPLSILVFCITRTDRPPRFHLLFAFFGMLGSVFVVRFATIELGNIITVLGMITYSSESFLGCTVEAWGDQSGDLVAALAIAQQGYQKMGLASCIAGPLFYLTTTLGITYLYKTILSEDSTFEVSQGSMGANCTVFLMMNLVLFLFSASTTNFYLRRSIGINMVIIYTLYVFYCVLSEYEVIHPFGTDHSEDLGLAYL